MECRGSIRTVNFSTTRHAWSLFRLMAAPRSRHHHGSDKVVQYAVQLFGPSARVVWWCGVVWWRRGTCPARDPSRFYLSLVVLLGGKTVADLDLHPKSSTDSSQPSTSSPPSLLVALPPSFPVGGPSSPLRGSHQEPPDKHTTTATHGTHVRTDPSMSASSCHSDTDVPDSWTCAPANGERATGFVRRETG